MMAGRRVSVDDVMTVAREDNTFYKSSGGGITLSGGEPLQQDKFTTAILQQCKAEGFHTAIDTCGHVSWRAMQKALPFVDLVLYDIKHISPLEHQRYTGANNRLILANLHRLCDFGVPVEIRMVIIPTINDSRELIEPTIQLLGSLNNITAVRLLSYHRLAGSKYDSLGKENTMPEVAPPGQRRMQQIAKWISRFGLKVILPPAAVSAKEPVSN
jgi:pyruvate formate lyase activating enzyme